MTYYWKAQTNDSNDTKFNEIDSRPNLEFPMSNSKDASKMAVQALQLPTQVLEIDRYIFGKWINKAFLSILSCVVSDHII
jgi:hypothetical protein